MTESAPARRALRLAVVVLLGLLAGVAGYLLLQRAGTPAPRPAPGWELRAPMPDPRGETASAVAGSRVVVAGGFTGLGFETTAMVSVYDAAADAWSPGPALPEPRNHAAAGALDGVVYVSGGAGPVGGATATMWSIRLDADLGPGAGWTALPAMPGPRSGHRMAAVGDRIYVVGGTGGAPAGPGATGHILIFDPATAAWSEGATMPFNRDHLGVVVVAGEIWAIGGRAGGQNHADVDIYDPATDAWREGPKLPEPVSGGAEAVLDGVIFHSGGEDPGRGAIIDRHWRLDTTAGAAAGWVSLAPPPLAVHGVPGAAVEGRFLVIAGSTRPGGQSNTGWTGAVQAFDPTP